MTRYARETSVPLERSRSELEFILKRYGADAFAYAYAKSHAVVQFQHVGRVIQFRLPYPPVEHFALSPGGRARSEKAMEEAQQQELRARWRALLLVIKAKLEAVECGISTFESEFLAWTVLPNGHTVGEHFEPQICKAIESGSMPLLSLPAPANGAS